MSGIMRIPSALSHKQRLNSFCRTETCFPVSHIARRQARVPTRCSRASSPGLASSGNTTSNASPGASAADSSPSGLPANVPGDWAVLAACGLALWKLSCLPPEALLVAAFWAPQIAVSLNKLRGAGFEPYTALALSTTFVSAAWAFICRFFVSASLAEHLGKGAERVVTLPLHLLHMLPLYRHLAKAAPKAAACLTILLSLLMPMALGVGLGYRHASTSFNRPASTISTASQPHLSAEPDMVEGQVLEASPSAARPTTEPTAGQNQVSEATEISTQPFTEEETGEAGVQEAAQIPGETFQQTSGGLGAGMRESPRTGVEAVQDVPCSQGPDAVLSEANAIDQFLREATAKQQDTENWPHMDRLRTKLSNYIADYGDEPWREEALVILRFHPPPSEAAKIEALSLLLLQPDWPAREEAALALAEAAAVDPASKSLAGQLGAVGFLRVVLERQPDQETASSSLDSLRAAAVVAVGVLCRDCPANAWLLVEDRKLGAGVPPTWAGLTSVLDGEAGPVQRAAAEVQQSIHAVYNAWRALRQGQHVTEPGRLLAAERFLTSVCHDRPALWKEILPLVLVNELLLSKNSRMHKWGVALLLVRRDLPEFEAVREACLPLLIYQLSWERYSAVQKNGAWALSRLSTTPRLRGRAIVLGALPALLRLLQISTENTKALHIRAAEAVRNMMSGKTTGLEAKAILCARAKAIPSILEILGGSPSDKVKDELSAALDAFSPGASEKMEAAFCSP